MTEYTRESSKMVSERATGSTNGALLGQIQIQIPIARSTTKVGGVKISSTGLVYISTRKEN